MTSGLRHTLAFVGAPFAVPLFAPLSALITGQVLAWPHPIVALLVVWVSFLLLLLFGLPCYLVLRRLNLLRFEVLVPLSVLAGAAIAPAMDINTEGPFISHYQGYFHKEAIIFGSVCGASIGVAFCLIAGITPSLGRAKA